MRTKRILSVFLVAVMVLTTPIGTLVPELSKVVDVFASDGSAGADATGTLVESVTGDPGTAKINLTLETINLGSLQSKAKAWSTDGGKKWSTAAFPTDAKKITALFDKGFTLHLAEGYDSKAKKPTNVIVEYAEVKKRPAANQDKLVPYYPDVSGDPWILVQKAKVRELTATYNVGEVKDKDQVLEYCKSLSDGKTPDQKWKAINYNAAGEFVVEDKPAKGGKKTLYFFRVKESGNKTAGYVPAGKQFKITPANFAATPNLKIDYKKEEIKFKKDQSYIVGSTRTQVTKAEPVKVANWIDKQDTIKVKLDAKGTKPGSRYQTIVPFERGDISKYAVQLTCVNGKIVEKFTLFEIDNGTKWGGLPRLSGTSKDTATFPIRLKPAKGNGAFAKDTASSISYKLVIEWDVIDKDAKTPKYGIVSAKIVP